MKKPSLNGFKSVVKGLLRTASEFPFLRRSSDPEKPDNLGTTTTIAQQPVKRARRGAVSLEREEHDPPYERLQKRHQERQKERRKSRERYPRVDEFEQKEDCIILRLKLVH